MRQRVEDLGRLAVMLRNLLDHKLFDRDSLPCRSKDYWEWFSQLSEDRKSEVLYSWVYGIESISESLCEMLDIAEGTDPLNEIVNERG